MHFIQCLLTGEAIVKKIILKKLANVFYLDSSLESKTKFKRISSLSDLVLKVELENNLEELKLPQV